MAIISGGNMEIPVSHSKSKPGGSDGGATINTQDSSSVGQDPGLQKQLGDAAKLRAAAVLQKMGEGTESPAQFHML